MGLLRPNTIGLVNLTDRMELSASGALDLDDLPSGRISVVSQYGGILGSLLSRAVDCGIGFAKLVATGKEADIDSTDMIAELLEGGATDAIAVYREGRADPMRSARRLAGLPNSASSSWSTRLGGRNLASARQRPIPTPWLAQTAPMMRCSGRPALSGPRPSPTFSIFPPPLWPAGGSRVTGWRSSPAASRLRVHCSRPGRVTMPASTHDVSQGMQRVSEARSIHHSG